MQHNRTNDDKIKILKSQSNLNHVLSNKNLARKKTLSNKGKSETKKSRKNIGKQIKSGDCKLEENSKTNQVQQHTQYYNNEKYSGVYNCNQKICSQNISDYACHNITGNKNSQNSSAYRSQDDNEQIKIGDGEYEDKKISPKIKFDCAKGVISFEGKLVKNQQIKLPEKTQKNWQKRNYSQWDLKSYQLQTDLYTDKNLSRSKQKSKKKFGKSKSRDKNNAKFSKDKNKNRITKIPEFVQQENYYKNKENDKLKKNKKSNITNKEKLQQIQQTLCTPNSYYYQRSQHVDLQIVRKQIINQQINFNHGIISIVPMKKMIHQQRCECIRIISRICGEMQYKKQTFALAVYLFDMYLSSQILFNKMKILVLSCLQLALKLEQGENGHHFMLHIVSSSSQNQNRNQSQNRAAQRSCSQNKSSKGERKNQSRQKSKKKKDTLKKKIVDIKARQHFQKQKILLKILNQQLQEKVCRPEMIQFEKLIFLKAEFKIWKSTYTYWIDLLTLIWDQFVLGQSQLANSQYNFSSILFRCETNMKNISYLSQILESCLYSPQFYCYNKVVLVLSVMYLLIRVNMEISAEPNSKNLVQTFDFYRNTLNKSSTILFIDRIGSNVLFGSFLLKLEIQMGKILNCCQFVSRYFQISPLIQFNYLKKQNRHSQNYDYNLAYHFYNPKLFNHFAK